MRVLVTVSRGKGRCSSFKWLLGGGACLACLRVYPQRTKRFYPTSLEFKQPEDREVPGAKGEITSKVLQT